MKIRNEIIEKNILDNCVILTEKEENLVVAIMKRLVTHSEFDMFFDTKRLRFNFDLYGSEDVSYPADKFKRALEVCGVTDKLYKIKNRIEKEYKFSIKNLFGLMDILWDCSDYHLNKLNDEQIKAVFTFKLDKNNEQSVRKQLVAQKWLRKHSCFVAYFYHKFPDFKNYNETMRKNKDKEEKKCYGLAVHCIVNDIKELPKCIGYEKYSESQHKVVHVPCADQNIVTNLDNVREGRFHCDDCARKVYGKNGKKQMTMDSKNYELYKNITVYQALEPFLNKETGTLKTKKEVSAVLKTYPPTSPKGKELRAKLRVCWLRDEVAPYHYKKKRKKEGKVLDERRPENDNKLVSLFRYYVNEEMPEKNLTRAFIKELVKFSYRKTKKKIMYDFKEVIDNYPILKRFLQKYYSSYKLATQEDAEKSNNLKFFYYPVALSYFFHDKKELVYCVNCGSAVNRLAESSKEHKYCSLDCKIEDSMENGIPNNHRYKYDDKIFDSSWEFIFYFVNKTIRKKNIERNPGPIPYEVKNDRDQKIHRYFPDFMMNGKLYEVKGNHLLNFNVKGEPKGFRNPFIKTDKERAKAGVILKAKWKCVIKNAKLITENDMKEYIDDLAKYLGKCATKKEDDIKRGAFLSKYVVVPSKKG